MSRAIQGRVFSVLALLAAFMSSRRAAGDAPAGQYVLHEEIVDDKRTGLSWQRKVDAASYSWEDAKKYCELLTIDGRGWRLPAYKELLTLVDPTQSSPAIDPGAFPDTPRAWFWTASPYVFIQANAWQVFFLDGTSIDVEKTKLNRVRCVR